MNITYLPEINSLDSLDSGYHEDNDVYIVEEPDSIEPIWVGAIKNILLRYTNKLQKGKGKSFYDRKCDLWPEIRLQIRVPGATLTLKRLIKY